MNKPYYIGFKDKALGKFLFMGPLENSWYSDFQSAKAHSMPEIKRISATVKRLNKDKKLRIIKINANDIKPI